MVVTGVLFLMMIFCVIPICCYKTQFDEEAEEEAKKQAEKQKKKDGDFDDPKNMSEKEKTGANRMD